MPKRMDLTGQKFGKWTVVARAGLAGRGRVVGAVQWLCECECGNTGLVQTATLRSGRSKGCRPCYARGRQLVGQRFGAWLVVEAAELRRTGQRYWLCRCDCSPDVMVKVEEQSLLIGKSKGCRHCAPARRRARAV